MEHDFFFFSYERMVTIESKLFESRIKRLYAADMNKAYLIIRSYLPEYVSSVFYIGCGIGGIDALLAAHYDFRNIYFYYMIKRKWIGTFITDTKRPVRFIILF